MPGAVRRFQEAVYQQLADIGRATASPRRLELLDLLAQGPRTVESLARETGRSMASTSQHLQLLRDACLVESSKAGLYVTYRLADDHVAHFCRELRLLAESRVSDLARVTRDFLSSQGQFSEVDQATLQQRVERGEVRVIDVRPAPEYRAGHIPGAVSFPLADLQRRLGELPRDEEIVAYCRGPYCVLAVEAVGRLRARGYRAERLEAGIPDWRASGRPVVTGNAPGRPARRRTIRGRTR